MAERGREGDGGGGPTSASKITIKIQNIVATVSLGQLQHRIRTLPSLTSPLTLGCTLDPEKIAQTVSNAEYNPRRFAAVIMRIREPRTTALVFKTGKMIVTGAKDISESQAAAKTYVKIIQRCGFSASVSDFKISNMSATVDFGFPIRLEGLMYAHHTSCTYEPELFPGLVYRMTEPKVVLLIFVSGKVVITGAKSVESLTQGMTNIHPHLIAFRKRSILLTV
jgi:transcription initiation factor TFIID TATA-box-binding protein